MTATAMVETRLTGDTAAAWGRWVAWALAVQASAPAAAWAPPWLALPVECRQVQEAVGDCTSSMHVIANTLQICPSCSRCGLSSWQAFTHTPAFSLQMVPMMLPNGQVGYVLSGGGGAGMGGAHSEYLTFTSHVDLEVFDFVSLDCRRASGHIQLFLPNRCQTEALVAAGMAAAMGGGGGMGGGGMGGPVRGRGFGGWAGFGGGGGPMRGPRGAGSGGGSFGQYGRGNSGNQQRYAPY